MTFDFNETNILVQAINELEKNPKAVINQAKLCELLYALGVHTEKRHTILRVAIKSLITKVEKLTDEDINRIRMDNKNEKIISSVCYELPTKS